MDFGQGKLTVYCLYLLVYRGIYAFFLCQSLVQMTMTRILQVLKG